MWWWPPTIKLFCCYFITNFVLLWIVNMQDIRYVVLVKGSSHLQWGHDPQVSESRWLWAGELGVPHLVTTPYFLYQFLEGEWLFICNYIKKKKKNPWSRSLSSLCKVILLPRYSCMLRIEPRASYMLSKCCIICFILTNRINSFSKQSLSILRI